MKLVRGLVLMCAATATLAAAPLVRAGQPYTGGPHAIPGIVELEDYSSSNRIFTETPVPWDGAGGLVAISALQDNDTATYQLDVAYTDTYELKIRGNLADYLASDPTTYQLLLDGVPVTDEDGNSTFSNYQGSWNWRGWSTTPHPLTPKILVDLTQGSHVLELAIDQGTGNENSGLNYFVFEAQSKRAYREDFTLGNQTKTLYVSPSGNDANPGTEAQPLKTFTRADALATPGTTVYARGGVYNERLSPQRSGEPGALIVYRSYPDETAVIDGTGLCIPELHGLVTLYNVSYVSVENFEIRNAGTNSPCDAVSTNNDGNPKARGYWNHGVSIDEAHHVIVRNNTIHTIQSSSVRTARASHDVLIADNEIYNTNLNPDDTEVSLGTYWYAYGVDVVGNHIHDTYGEAIGVAAGPHHVRVDGNEVHNVGKSGWRGIGIYVDAWTEYQDEVQVVGNYVHENGSEGIAVGNEGGGLLERVYVYNNVLYDTGWAGQIGVVSWANANETSSETHPLNDVFIYNNTISASSGYDTRGSIFINNWQAKHIVIKNNIMDSGSCGSGAYYSLQGVCVTELNCSQVNCSAIGGELTISDNLYGQEPQFVSEANQDFRLTANSPAIDAGLSVIDQSMHVLAPSTDADNQGRPAGSAYDIGAYEYGAVSPPPEQATDLDDDGDTDWHDLWMLVGNFGKSGLGDLNDSGTVDVFDFTSVVAGFVRG